MLIHLIAPHQMILNSPFQPITILTSISTVKYVPLSYLSLMSIQSR